MTFYDYTVPAVDGGEVSMKEFEGKVVLVVNTATGCGFTSQYEPLEAMYEKYHEQGLEIVDVPCNQFMDQAPGTDAEIREFCTLHYNTKFLQMKKADVNGENQLPLYGFLKEQKGFEGLGEGEIAEGLGQYVAQIDPEYQNNADIKWNFTKFVIDRAGNVVARFEPTADMGKVEKCVASLL